MQHNLPHHRHEVAMNEAIKETKKEILTATMQSAPDNVMGPSFAIIGRKRLSKAARELRLRRRKTFVQKVFLELVNKFSEIDLQSLLYLDFYQELCDGLMPFPSQESTAPHFLHRPVSPYFIKKAHDVKEPKIRHKDLKQRFLKLSHKRAICLRPKDPFQLACTLQSMWEQALRLVEHQYSRGTTLFEQAEKMVAAGKTLPQSFCPFEEKKSLMHISSLKMPLKGGKKRLKHIQEAKIKEFIQATLAFGFEFSGLAQP
ncbi:MAG TPA: hypothetical protein VN457_06765 [Chlamydiales bacterium]|nr:hypothetical protein [Chlamydiales bacterium]